MTNLEGVVGCEDCGLSYQEFSIDAVLPNEQWKLIHPEGSKGLLCANCIIKRASFLPHIIFARITLEFTSSLILTKFFGKRNA